MCLAEDSRQASEGEIPTWKSVLLQELLLGEDFHSLEEEEKEALKPAESPSAFCIRAFSQTFFCPVRPFSLAQSHAEDVQRAPPPCPQLPVH